MKKVHEYLVIIENSGTSFGASSPDLPGCVAIAKTRREVKKLMKEAIKFHIEGLKADGLSIPVPQSKAEYMKITT